MDIIHGHSSHHVQVLLLLFLFLVLLQLQSVNLLVYKGIEIHNEKPIIYGCGDFVDDYAVHPEFKNNLGFMYFVDMDAESKKVKQIRLTPTKIDLMCVTKTLPPKDSQWLSDTMQRLCSPLGTKPTEQSDGSLLITKKQP